MKKKFVTWVVRPSASPGDSKYDVNRDTNTSCGYNFFKVMYSKKKKVNPCNIHVYTNSTLIAILLIINLLFISAHWDHTKKKTTPVFMFTATQNADEWERYPTNGHSIPNLDIESLNTYLVCCSYEYTFSCAYGKSYIGDVGFESSVQRDKGHTFLVLYSKSGLNGTACRLTWE